MNFNSKKTTHAIATLHTIRLYTHIKNIPFQSFMNWAFGDHWEMIRLKYIHTRWNERHSQLVVINKIEDMSSVIYNMVDWYINMNKPI